MKKNIYATVNVSGQVILPLLEAQKVQAILAEHGILVDYAYRTDDDNLHYLMEDTQPAVEIKPMPTIDMRGRTWHERQAWSDAVRESKGNNYLSPQEFFALRGGQE